MKKTENNFIDLYLEWLRKEMTATKVGKWTEITTPFLDRHNDYIQIYLCEKNGKIVITDDGYTINDLEMSGCDIFSSQRRKDILNLTLKGFGVSLANSALAIEADRSDVPLKKHLLIQAILAVNDLFYLSKPHVESLFLDDVTLWLDENNIRYSSNVKITGKSGYDHVYDFIIPKSKDAPERFLKVINKPARTEVSNLVFMKMDTSGMRPNDFKTYAFINDLNASPAKAMINPLEKYDIGTILWKKRDDFRSVLAS